MVWFGTRQVRGSVPVLTADRHTILGLLSRIKEEIRKYGKFGLGLAIDMIPISTCDSDQAPDLYVTVQEEQKMSSEEPVWNEVCKRRMTDLVQELVDNGEL